MANGGLWGPRGKGRGKIEREFGEREFGGLKGGFWGRNGGLWLKGKKRGKTGF